MSVTYIGDASTNLDTIRTRLGDIGGGVGILPGGTNFSDALINNAIAQQGGVGGAMAWLLRAALTRWSVVAESRTVGSRSETNSAATRLTALLATIEQEYDVGIGLQVGAIDLNFIEKDG